MAELECYLEEIVKPTVADFEQHPTSVRHAFLACVATCHAVDHLDYPKKARASPIPEFERSPRTFRIDDVAHAFSIVTTGDPPRLRAKNVISRPPGGAGQLAIGLSRIGDGVGGVTLQEERSVDLLQTLRRTVEFLHSKVGAVGHGHVSCSGLNKSGVSCPGRLQSGHRALAPVNDAVGTA